MTGSSERSNEFAGSRKGRGLTVIVSSRALCFVCDVPSGYSLPNYTF
jgi:hypothetical protein